jgi:hypothetical protein
MKAKVPGSAFSNGQSMTPVVLNVVSRMNGEKKRSRAGQPAALSRPPQWSERPCSFRRGSDAPSIAVLAEVLTGQECGGAIAASA